MKDLEEAGVITTGYRRIRVTDPDALARLAKLPREQHGREGRPRVVDVRTGEATRGLRLASDAAELSGEASGA